MADERVVNSVKIVDPTTTSQIAGVTAAGNLRVILASNTGVDVGDVDVLSVIPGVAATNLGKAVDAVAGATDTGVAILGVRDDVLGGITPAAGDYTTLLVDANGALWTHDDALDAALAGSELQVDIVAALPTGANTIGSIASITTNIVPGVGATHLGKAEDGGHVTGDTGVMFLGVRNDANASLAGTDLDYTPIAVDASGNLQVDILSGAGSDTPTSPVVVRANTTDTAAGSTSGTTIQTADLGSGTHRLSGFDCSASVPIKVILQQVDNAVAVDRVTLFDRSGAGISWRPPHREYFNVTFGGTAGFDGWRLLVTNLDTSEAADLYGTLYYQNN